MGIYNNDEAVSFLREHGYSGTYNDMMLAWLRDVFSTDTYTLNDLLKRYESIYGKEFNVIVLDKGAEEILVTSPAATFTSTTPTDGGGGTTVLTSAGTHAFTAATAVGASIEITAGTGWTPGLYEITAIDLDTTGVAITIDVEFDAGMGSPTIVLVGSRITMKSFTIPPLLANSMLRLDHTVGDGDGDTTNKVRVVDFGGTDYLRTTLSSSQYMRRIVVISNRNSVSSQIGGNHIFTADSDSSKNTAPPTSSVDTSVSTTLSVCVELSANDTLATLDRWILELFK